MSTETVQTSGQWKLLVLRLEAEARAIFAKGIPRDGQPRNRLQSAALLVINSAQRLLRAREANRLDDALNYATELFSNYEELWILRDVPGYKRRALITRDLIKDMNRGVVASRGIAKAVRNGAPRHKREKGAKTLSKVKAELRKLEKIPSMPKHGRAARVSENLKITPRQVRKLIRKHAL